MKITLAWIVLVLLLGLFGASAVVAGDDVPGGGSVPAVLYLAGDDVPGGG